MDRVVVMNSIKGLDKASKLYHTAGTLTAVLSAAEISLLVYSMYKAKKAKTGREFKEWVWIASVCGIYGLGLMGLSAVMDTQSFVAGSTAATASGHVAIMDAINAIKA